MNVIHGDIIGVAKAHVALGKNVVVVQQANNMKVAGAGLALQIRNTYPEWFADYSTREDTHLGDVYMFGTKDNFRICDFYAQGGYGKDKRYTDYVAFEDCLEKLEALMQDERDTVILFPHGIGCGLGGGDWQVISALIEDYFPLATLVKK